MQIENNIIDFCKAVRNKNENIGKKIMQYEVMKQCDNLVEQGYLKRRVLDDLILYDYTPQCVFEKYWNEYTLNCRGLIFNSDGTIAAKSFPKFFNFLENELTQYKNLPNLPYEIFDKVDGSLGISYWNKGKIAIATRGSFTSIQSQTATEILHSKNIDWENIGKDLTFLFEIVYPENRLSDGARLVVDYGDMKDLVLLAIYNVKTLEELPYDQVMKFGNKHGFPVVTKYDMSLDEAIALQKSLPSNKEGFVIRYSNGFRVKIKGEEYTRISRIINSLTPLIIWENLVNSELCVSFYYGVPEEYHNEIKDIVAKLKKKYNKILEEIDQDQEKLPKYSDNLDAHRKAVGLIIQGEHDLKHPKVVFAKMLGKSVDKYIKECIRPLNNEITE